MRDRPKTDLPQWEAIHRIDDEGLTVDIMHRPAGSIPHYSIQIGTTRDEEGPIRKFIPVRVEQKPYDTTVSDLQELLTRAEAFITAHAATYFTAYEQKKAERAAQRKHGSRHIMRKGKTARDRQRKKERQQTS